MSSTNFTENVNETVKGHAIRGYAAPGFEPVVQAFVENFLRRAEVGAACAVYRGDEPLLDLYGGEREAGSPWTTDTMACVHSTTKGVVAVAMAMAHSRGYFELDAPVADYWPEFGCNGKQDITLRQIFAHTAGLPIMEEEVGLDTLADFDALAKILARQKPQWPPGSQSGYHGWTVGFYQNEILRRTDPQQRTIGRFVADEITGPLGVEFYIGLPDSIPDDRIANEIVGPRMMRELLADAPLMTLGMLVPGWLRRKGLAHQMLTNPRELADIQAFHGRPVRRVEVPAGNGIGTARALARIMGACATGGEELGISQATRAELESPHPLAKAPPKDRLLGIPTIFQMGFQKPGAHYDLGGRSNGYLAPGAGGNMCFADPDSGIGFGYILNRFGGYLLNDPRELALRQAAMKAVG